MLIWKIIFFSDIFIFKTWHLYLDPDWVLDPALNSGSQKKLIIFFISLIRGDTSFDQNFQISVLESHANFREKLLKNVRKA